MKLPSPAMSVSIAALVVALGGTSYAAATINGAHALGMGKTHGSLEKGKVADLLCYDAEDHREIPYYFGVSGAAWTMKAGVQL